MIGGDKVDVSLLLPLGMDSHSYEPTPADIININKSDLFIYTGESMEPWAHSIIESVDNNDVLVLDVSKGVSLIAPNSTVDDSEEEHDHELEEEHNHDVVEERIMKRRWKNILIMMDITIRMILTFGQVRKMR